MFSDYYFEMEKFLSKILGKVFGIVACDIWETMESFIGNLFIMYCGTLF
jgi:hypothetical protein